MGNFSPSSQPRSTRDTSEDGARFAPHSFWDRILRRLAPPTSAGKANRGMSTAIEPNAPQGTPSAFEITGATPAPTETLGLNARRVIAKRYSLKDAQANAIEEWPDIVRRVVGHVAGAETDIVKRDEFYQTMSVSAPATWPTTRRTMSGHSSIAFACASFRL